MSFESRWKISYLTCETCRKLWEECGVAARTDQDAVSPDTSKTLEPILKEIEMDEAEAQADVSTAALGLWLSKCFSCPPR